MKEFFIILVSIFLFSACKQDNYSAKIAELETSLSNTYDKSSAQKLMNLYLEAAKANPSNKDQNFAYLSKAAEIWNFKLEDPFNAVRTLNEAFDKYADDKQDKQLAIKTLMNILNGAKYHSGTAANVLPEDQTAMRNHLRNHQRWIDSSLIKLDREMGTPAVNNKAKAEQFLEMAEGYADLIETENPEKFVSLLMKAAGLAKTIDNPTKSLQLYSSIVERLPGHPKTPTALFMTGFIYENDLGKLDKAKEAYMEFLKRFPKDEFADDAQNSLKMLGKSPEDIIKEFEKNQQK